MEPLPNMKFQKFVLQGIGPLVRLGDKPIKLFSAKVSYVRVRHVELKYIFDFITLFLI